MKTLSWFEEEVAHEKGGTAGSIEWLQSGDFEAEVLQGGGKAIGSEDPADVGEEEVPQTRQAAS